MDLSPRPSPQRSSKRSRAQLLTSLQTVAAATTATPAERLLAAEADDAVRFVTALLRRYDAVLQNPPFGEPIPATKPYLKAAYPWIPTKDYNLLAAFVGRSLECAIPVSVMWEPSRPVPGCSSRPSILGDAKSS